MRRALEALGCGVMVYVAMAACSAAPSITVNAGAGGAYAGAGGAGIAGGMREAGPGVWDALGEAVTDPVPDAHADAPHAATIVTRPCSTTTANWLAAEAMFPGKTAAELALVRAVLNYPPEAEGLFSSPPGYTGLLTTTYVRDGAVAAACTGGAAAKDWTVTFVLP